MHGRMHTRLPYGMACHGMSVEVVEGEPFTRRHICTYARVSKRCIFVKGDPDPPNPSSIFKATRRQANFDTVHLTPRDALTVNDKFRCAQASIALDRSKDILHDPKNSIYNLHTAGTLCQLSAIGAERQQASIIITTHRSLLIRCP